MDVVNRGFARYGLGSEDVEDVVQETLLALHLKRHTWDERRAFFPWVQTIAQNKLVDNLRRRGHRAQIPLDDVMRDACCNCAERGDEWSGCRAHYREAQGTTARHRGGDLHRGSERTSRWAERLGMTEGAVRVALHRALQSLAKAFQSRPGMKTEDLINAIVQDGASRQLSMAARMSVALVLGGIVAAALFMSVLRVRPDITQALQTWRFDIKVAIALVCFGVALWATYELARPDADTRRALLVSAVPLALLVVAVGCELIASPVESWTARAIGTNSRLCLASITTLSIAPLVALLFALRAGAARSPALAGAAAGLLAGSLAATLYATHCVDDSPLFVALWYTPAIALVASIGAGAGSRLLRW